ncbi:MAG: hypothetical protein M0Z53_08040 [Thermaerobacter sp.]|nr:hypothetical protein [Thermaerobacter sp.]
MVLVAGLGATAGIWLGVQSVADGPPWQRPLRLLQPIPVARLLSAGGEALWTSRRVRVVAVVPGQMPTWARRMLPRRLRQVTEGLWTAPPAGWVDSAVAGIHTISVNLPYPVTGVSPTLLAVAARGAGAWRTAAVVPQPGAWQPRVAGEKSTSLQLRLVHRVSGAIPSGGVAIVLGGQGQILAAEANPSGRGMIWQPYPAGLTLIPPLLAQALVAPSLLAGMKTSTGLPLLTGLADRWGGAAVNRALARLGLGRGMAIPGQPVPNPALPSASPLEMSFGRALWATPLEVARAYLPFVDGGALPAVSTTAPSSARQAPATPVATVHALSTVSGSLPEIVAGPLRFRVWRPAGSFAVAFTGQAHGLVVVAAGPATARFLSLLKTVAKSF